MNAGIKLIIGLVIALIGLYWYGAGFAGIPNIFPTFMGATALSALKTVFVGLFGLFLIFIGLIVAWIEYEDLKWEMREKKTVKKRK